jgi:hypothetical protein
VAKQQSLAAKEGALQAVPELKLPAIFQAPQEKIKPRYVAPYVCFAHPKRADEWKKLTAKFGQVDEGDMFFVSQEDLVKVDTIKVGWLCHKQYWVHMNAGGTDVIAASWTEKPKPFKEHIECVVLVYFDDKIVPANMQLRTTKCGAAREISQALEECVTPAWGEKSAAHKETLVVNQPFGRFFAEMTLGEKRRAKTSGMLYKPLLATVKPTTLVEWRLLKAFSEDADAQKRLEDAAARFENRINELKPKIAPA